MRTAWPGGSGCASARMKLWKGAPGRWAASRGDPAGHTSALLLARNMPSVQYLLQWQGRKVFKLSQSCNALGR